MAHIYQKHRRKHSQERGMGKIKKFIIFIAVIIAIPIIIMINNPKEKGLDDVINYNIENVDYLAINNELKTDKKENIKDLSKLLSQYRVKKMKESDWDSDVSKENGFFISIYSNGEPIILASIYENRLVLYNTGEYYEVLNGPIDMGWVDKVYSEVDQ